jgi:hypothetical protein
LRKLLKITYSYKKYRYKNLLLNTVIGISNHHYRALGKRARNGCCDGMTGKDLTTAQSAQCTIYQEISGITLHQPIFTFTDTNNYSTRKISDKGTLSFHGYQLTNQ